MFPSNSKDERAVGRHRQTRSGCPAAQSDKSTAMSVVKKWAEISLLVGILTCVFALQSPSSASDPNAIDVPEMDGFTVLTSAENASIAPRTVIIEYRGPIVSPMSANMREIWTRISRANRFDTLVLRLDSQGGVDTEGNRVIDTLVSVRERMTLITLVGERDLCASMCVALFIQGHRRYAKPTSAWIFHGASPRENGTPDARMTTRHFEIYRQRGIELDFIDYLRENDFLSRPGGYWISGGELAQRSNIITKLMANWQPTAPKQVAEAR